MKHKTDFQKTELGYWMLPKPSHIKRWERIPRLSKRTVPFGYRIDPEDDRWLEPIATELELLELAKKHLKQYSYREVSAWGFAAVGVGFFANAWVFNALKGRM